jgi:signal transduction histidine kinase
MRFTDIIKKRSILLALFLLIIPFFYSDQSLAQERVNLAKNDTRTLLTHALFFEDKSKKLPWQEVLKQINWQKNDTNNFNGGISENNFWFKVDLNFEQDHLRIFQVSYPPLDYVTFYIISQGRLIKEVQTGDLIPFEQRELKDHHYVISHNALKNQTITLLIKVKTQGSIVFPLLTASIEEYAAQRSLDQIGYGLYFGISISMLIYNLLLFFYLKDRSYLYYCAFVAGILFNSLAYTGIGFQWLWPDYPNFNRYAIPVTIALSFLTASVFAQSFLQIKQRSKIAQHIFTGCIIFSLFAIVFTLFAEYSQSIKLVAVLQFILALIFLFTALYLWKKGVKEAKYFTIAWIAFLVGISLISFRILGLLPSNHLTIYAILYGTTIEMLLLSLGLAYRFEILRGKSHQLSKELDTAKNKAFIQLERYRDLFNNSPAGLFHYWRVNNVFDVNQHAIALIPSDQDLASFLRQKLPIHHYKTLLKEGKLTEVTISLGNNTWYSTSMAVLRDSDQRVQEIEGTIIDISIRKQNEQLALNNEQGKINSLTQLVMGISHQFNTPLGVILIAQGVTNHAVEQLEHKLSLPQPSLSEIKKEVNMIQKGMTLSCSNSDKLLIAMRELKFAIGNEAELNVSIFDPKEILDKLSNISMSNNTPIKFTINNEQNLKLKSDINIFIDIFNRLFTNSIEHGFSLKGAAEIRIDIQQNKKNISLHFQDNGRGLTHEEKESIFVPFYTGNTRKEKNSGLGMYIIHNQVTNVLSGKIQLVNSTENSLSGFSLEILLPIKNNTKLK